MLRVLSISTLFVTFIVKNIFVRCGIFLVHYPAKYSKTRFPNGGKKDCMNSNHITKTQQNRKLTDRHAAMTQFAIPK